MDVVRIEQRRHVPVLYRADALGLNQAGAGDLGCIAQAHAAKRSGHGAAGLGQRLGAVREELDLLVRYRAVLLDVVVVVQVILVHFAFLAHDIVKIEAILGHVAAGLGRAVTLRVNQPAALAVRGDLELLGNQHGVAKVVPFLPAFVREAERASVAVNALQVDADGLLQVGLNDAGHGRYLRDLDRVLFQTIVFAQRLTQVTCMHEQVQPPKSIGTLSGCWWLSADSTRSLDVIELSSLPDEIVSPAKICGGKRKLMVPDYCGTLT